MTDADRQWAYGRLQSAAREPHPSDGIWRSNWPEIVLTVILSAAVIVAVPFALCIVAGWAS